MDGKTVVYKAWKAGRYYRVVGDNKGEAYDHIDYPSSPAFSKNGKGIAYIGGKQKKVQVVFNGKPGECFNNIENLCVSADGATVAYHAFSRKDDDDRGSYFVVVNDKKSAGYDDVLPPVIFSPDGTKVAFGARKSYQDSQTSQFLSEYWWKVMKVK